MEGVSQPSGTVTLVFTDVEGSTRLLESLGPERYRDELGRHRRVVREAFARHGGYEVDFEGDAFFFAFSTAAGGVDAVLEAVAALEGGPIVVRVGIHTGEPILDPPKYIGLDVHKASRIMSAGHGGQVLLSQATRDLVAVSGLRDLGEHRLKDFGEPVRLFQVGPGDFPPLKTLNNTNLPVPSSSFVGRGRELAAVAALLRSEGRLVTLSGPGGSGKTRLAIAAAEDVLGDYADGVFWVGLASLREPAAVVETIAQALGASDGLVGRIGDRSLLLVLDNFEHVIDAATELSALLGACRNLRLLVTSRELLRLQGEVEYQVPPLAESEAEDLFCARSRLEPDDEIAELCRHLDDLPLAVELAAARTAVLSPTQIRDRLSQRLDLFRGSRDADPRQQTLRATIEWSYELLTEPEKRLFARLAVFAGGCTFEEAEEISGADVDGLQSLVDKSLVRRSGGRFWMLETIRELARERLHASEDAGEVERRHAHYFVELAERAEPELKGAEQPVWLERLEDDHDNLRASLDWFLEHDEPEPALRLAVGVYWLWYTHGHVSEGRRWLRRALEAAPDTPSEVRAKALDDAGYLAMEQGEFEEARRLLEASLACAKEVGAISTAALAAAHLSHARERTGGDGVGIAEEGLALARESGDLFSLAIALNCLANVLVAGDLERARPYFEESLELRRRLGDRSRIALALNNLAWRALVDDDLRRAAALYAEAAEIAAAIGDKRHVSMAEAGLGWVAYREKRWDEAADRARSSVRLSRELGMKEHLIEVILCLAGIAAATGEPERAATLAAAAQHQFALIAPESQLQSELFHHVDIENAKAACDRETWDRGWTAGRAMSLDQAAAHALSVL
jgi:predicted ATPase